MTVRCVVVAALLLAGCGASGAGTADNAATGDVASAEVPERSSAPGEPRIEPPRDAQVGTNVVAPAGPARPAHPCQYQGDRALPAMHLRGVGTEPFWAARIEGRCVTYSTPEDQDGTRVWTQFSGSAERGEWSGHLDDRPFVLRTRSEPGCSDGMSDKRYPIAVSLSVRGEERAGCAEPL